jgi:chromosome partitioning protein
MIYAVTNRKGGQGKTTLATSLAQRIAQKLPDKRVLIIDVDPQGHAGAALGLQTNGHCISQLLLGTAGIKEVIVPADRSKDGGPSRPNLFVVPASDRLADAKTELEIRSFVSRGKRNEVNIDTILEDKLGPIIGVFAYIFIDCPPSLDRLAPAVYGFADKVIVPIKMAYLDSDGARQQLENVLEAQSNGASVQIGHVVPTFFRARELVARETLLQLARLYPDHIAFPIPQSAIVEQAQAAGQMTVFEYEPSSTPAKAMDRLVKKILKEGGYSE